MVFWASSELYGMCWSGVAILQGGRRDVGYAGLGGARVCIGHRGGT